MPPINNVKNKKPSMKFSKGTVKRLLHMITKNHKKQLVFVIVCILISALAIASHRLRRNDISYRFAPASPEWH